MRSSFGSEFAGGTVVELAFAIPDLIEPWTNPYFDPGQQLTQNAVTIGSAFTSAAAGAGAAVGVEAIWVGVFAADPPAGVLFGVGVVVGVGVNYAWEHLAEPAVSWIFVDILHRPDPYSDIRNLRPLGAN